jgi:putative transposase
MPNFRRYYLPNSIIFITIVTKERYPYFSDSKNIDLLWQVLRNVQQIHPFNLLAYVILPNHLHWLMRVNDKKGNFSRVAQSYKRNFTLEYKKVQGISGTYHVWQERFWDHIIRDDTDLEKHFDYIHWNPVKHRIVQHPEDWLHSSYTHWQTRGYYPNGWGWGDEPQNILLMDFE